MIQVINPDRRYAVREAGEKYCTMAADLSLVHISMAAVEEAVQGHINNLLRNMREQAAQQAGADLAAVWKEAALKAAQARLEAAGGSDEAKQIALSPLAGSPSSQPMKDHQNCTKCDDCIA